MLVVTSPIAVIKYLIKQREEERVYFGVQLKGLVD